MTTVIEDMIELAKTMDMKFMPIGSYNVKSDAEDAAAIIKENYASDEVDFIVQEEEGTYYVGIVLEEGLKCGGKLDEYCPICKTVHFDSEGLNSAELARKKEQYYKEMYGHIRDKG